MFRRSTLNRLLIAVFSIAALVSCPGVGSVPEDGVATPKQDTDKLSNNVPADTPKLESDKPVEKKPVVDDRSSRSTARSKGDFTFDDIKFDIEKGAEFKRDMLPKKIEELHQKPMKIRGYILPASVFKQTGIEEFVLVRDNMECCFGPGAAIYDCIKIEMEKGKKAEFTTRPVAVKGKFEIHEFKFPDGTLAAIYKLIATEVK